MAEKPVSLSMGPEMDMDFGWRVRVKGKRLALIGLEGYLRDRFKEIAEKLASLEEEGLVEVVGTDELAEEAGTGRWDRSEEE